MIRSINKIKFFVSAFALVVSGCERDDYLTKNSIGIVADVLTLSSSELESPAQSPQYVFKPQKFTLINNIASMSAPGLKLIQGGEIEIFAASGSLITSGFLSGGDPPYIDYTNHNGVIKAKDDRSLAMISAMYHFDSFLASMKSLSGFSHEQLLDSGQVFQVIFQPAILLNDEGAKIRQYESGNAAYIAGAKQFALYKSGSDESIPLIVNPQAIAHEFGHAMFELSFFQNSFESCDKKLIDNEIRFPGRLELEYIIRGLNEGFADFVSFVLTGSTNLLESSFGKTIQSEERNFSNIKFKYDTLSESNASCTGEIYCIGSVFARALLDTYIKLGLDVKNRNQREDFLKALFTVLKGTGSKLKSGNEYELPIADEKVASCQLRSSRNGILDDELLGVFFKAFVSSVAVEQKQAYCASFAEHFGESGFAPRYRDVCS